MLKEKMRNAKLLASALPLRYQLIFFTKRIIVFLFLWYQTLSLFQRFYGLIAYNPKNDLLENISQASIMV